MKNLTLIIIALLFSISAFAQQSVEADFTQTRVMKVSGKTIEKAGHLTFDGNNLLEMIYTNPEGEYFIIDGMTVKINLDGKKAELDAEKAKMVQLQRATLLNCISGNWEQAAQDNEADLTVTEEDGIRTVLIKAKGKVPRGGYSYVELTYLLSNNQMTKMVLEDALGIKNTYIIN